VIYRMLHLRDQRHIAQARCTSNGPRLTESGMTTSGCFKHIIPVGEADVYDEEIFFESWTRRE